MFLPYFHCCPLPFNADSAAKVLGVVVKAGLWTRLWTGLWTVLPRQGSPATTQGDIRGYCSQEDSRDSHELGILHCSFGGFRVNV